MMSTEESVKNETMHPDTVVNARLLGAQHVLTMGIGCKYRSETKNGGHQ